MSGWSDHEPARLRPGPVHLCLCDRPASSCARWRAHGARSGGAASGSAGGGGALCATLAYGFPIKSWQLFSFLPHGFLELRHLSAKKTRGFPRLSAWRVNRQSRQVRRSRGQREGFPGFVPPVYPPVRARNPRKTCASRRRPAYGRGFVTRRGGVPYGRQRPIYLRLHPCHTPAFSLLIARSRLYTRLPPSTSTPMTDGGKDGGKPWGWRRWGSSRQ